MMRLVINTYGIVQLFRIKLISPSQLTMQCDLKVL
nr:MAG TPA: hypothetical protein [Bacteriophage sp.]